MQTCDTLFDGKLLVFQDKDGYRFSLDAVLLAGLTDVKAQDRVADLGTGCGVIPMILAYRNRGSELVGIEIQQDLADLARRNVDANGLSERIHVLQMDFTKISRKFEPGSFDVVMSNPPYRRLETGRVNPNRQRALARHEIAASVVHVLATAKYLLHTGGRLAIVYPAARLDHLLVAARRSDFVPKRLTIIYSNLASPACLVHLECRKGGGEELQIAPPFLIYQEDGTYTEAMRALYL